MSVQLRLASFMLAVMTGAGAAQGGDPLNSSECLLALRKLEAQEAASSAAASGRATAEVEVSGRPALASLEKLRRAAAQACLSSRPDSPAPARRLAQPPLSVAPAAPSVARATLPAAGKVIQPAVQIPPLISLTGCDAMGCWASDGTRLQRMGPALVGPRGVCSVQGAVLSCP